MIEAATQTSQQPPKTKTARPKGTQETDELRRATADNARHEREGSWRKVTLGRQLYRIQQETLYVLWGYVDLPSYTKEELKFEQNQADYYIKARGLSLELVAGTDHGLRKLAKIAQQDEPLHAPLLDALRKRPGLDPHDLQRGGEAGRQVLAQAAAEDEATLEQARQRAYEAALRIGAQDAPRSELEVDLERMAKHTQQITTLTNRRRHKLAQEGEAGAQEALLQKTDETVCNFLQLYIKCNGVSEMLRACLSKEAKGEEPATSEAEEPGGETTRTEDAAADAASDAPEADEAAAEDEAPPQSQPQPQSQSQSPQSQSSPPPPPPPQEEVPDGWLERAVQGVVRVLDEPEKQRLSDLVFAALRGAEVAPLRSFLGAVQPRVPPWAREDLSAWLEAAGHKDLWTRWHFLFSFFVEAKLPEMRMRLFLLRALQLPPPYAKMVQEVYPGIWGPYEDMLAPQVPPGASAQERRVIEARWFLEVALRLSREMKREDLVSDLAKEAVMGQAYDLEGELTQVERWLKEKTRPR